MKTRSTFSRSLDKTNTVIWWFSPCLVDISFHLAKNRWVSLNIFQNWRNEAKRGRQNPSTTAPLNIALSSKARNAHQRLIQPCSSKLVSYPNALWMNRQFPSFVYKLRIQFDGPTDSSLPATPGLASSLTCILDRNRRPGVFSGLWNSNVVLWDFYGSWLAGKRVFPRCLWEQNCPAKFPNWVCWKRRAKYLWTLRLVHDGVEKCRSRLGRKTAQILQWRTWRAQSQEAISSTEML